MLLVFATHYYYANEYNRDHATWLAELGRRA
jgi:hypothetical protein